MMRSDAPGVAEAASIALVTMLALTLLVMVALHMLPSMAAVEGVARPIQFLEVIGRGAWACLPYYVWLVTIAAVARASAERRTWLPAVSVGGFVLCALPIIALVAVFESGRGAVTVPRLWRLLPAAQLAAAGVTALAVRPRSTESSAWPFS